MRFWIMERYYGYELRTFLVSAGDFGDRLLREREGKAGRCTPLYDELEPIIMTCWVLEGSID